MSSSFRYARDIEKTVYRFLLSVVAGFLFGCYMVPSLPPIAYNVLPRSWCSSKLISSNQQSREFQMLKQLSAIDDRTGNVYIGMMSMESKLDTRTAAAFQTWAKRHPKVVVEVFANNNGTKDKRKRFISTTLTNGAKVIQLPGVKDRDYPPQKKSFSMIKFMHDSYLHNFDWFVRLDDDAYVDTERLHQFLSRVNSSLPWYIGSPGFGKDEDDQLSKKENYCMGGPGVIMSRALLQKLGPRLGECLRSLYTAHEDIELGRCIQRMTGVKCAMAWQTRKLFYQNYQKGSYASNIENIGSTELDEGIIFHANKHPVYQHQFHAKVLKRKIAHIMDKVAKLENEIRTEQGEKDSDKGVNLRGHHRWNAVVGSILFKTDESELARRMRDGLKRAILDSTNAGLKVINSENRTKTGKLTAADLIQGYHYQNPLYSADTISHVLCTYSRKTEEGQFEYHVPRSVYARQYFTRDFVFVNELPGHSLEEAVHRSRNFPKKSEQKNENVDNYQLVPVNFLIALSGRPDNFFRFLRNFESTFLARGERVNLYISYFAEQTDQNSREVTRQEWIEDADSDLKVRDSSDRKRKDAFVHNSDERYIVENLSALEQAYPASKLKVLFMKQGTEFSRGLGLQRAANEVVNSNEIIFFCDVDLVLAPELLLHIRRNTVQGQQVYYPVFFSQYDPDVVYVEKTKPINHFRFSELDGFWRHFSYGMVSLFKGDFEKTGGFDLSIRGWGLEDIHLVNSILNARLQIFKSTEPAEVHVYHDKFCDPSLTEKQYTDCLRSRAAHYGPRTLLYYLWKAPETSFVDESY